MAVTYYRCRTPGGPPVVRFGGRNRRSHPVAGLRLRCCHSACPNGARQLFTTNRLGVLCGYLFDMPEAARGDAYANALRNSGAARMLLPYRVHRARAYADTLSEVNSVVGDVGNPVTALSISGDISNCHVCGWFHAEFDPARWHWRGHVQRGRPDGP